MKGLVTPGDPAQTAKDITESIGWFRLGIAALYLGQLAAEVKAKDVRQPQVVELITTGRTEGVESELPTSVDEGVTA